MPTFLFSPRWLALHIVAVVLVVAFVALGWWQLDAYRMSEERHDLRESEPVALEALGELGDSGNSSDSLDSAEPPLDRPVVVDGTYLADLTVPARVKDGVLGTYAAGALDTGEGVLIVLRGWVQNADDVLTAPSGPVTVTGYVLPAESAASATGLDLGDGEVGYLAPDTVEAVTGREGLYDGLLLATGERPAPPAALERVDVDEYSPIRNVGPWQNLSYWAQWWVFAGAVIIFWVSFVRTGVKRSRQTDEPAPDVAPESSPRPSAQR